MKNLMTYTPEPFENLEIMDAEYNVLASEGEMEDEVHRVGGMRRPHSGRGMSRHRPSLKGRSVRPRVHLRPRVPVAIPFAPLGSEHVRWVQETLNRALGLRLMVDGIMSRETRSALRTFQRRYGLPVTGFIGPDTEEMLIRTAGGSMSEEDLFLGKMVRRASRAASRAAKSASRAVRKTAKSAYKAGKKGAQYAGKHAGKVGSYALPPGAGAAIKFGRDVARGKNVVSSFKSAAKANIDDMRKRMRHAQIAASIVPGAGTGVSAALGAANALADGRPITDAAIEAARGAIPGGPLAQAAFDMGINLAQGQNLSNAALGAARNRLPAGARAAFDTAVALGKGQNLQQAALAAARGHLPPEARAGLDTAMALGRGQSLQQAAWGNARRFLPKYHPSVRYPYRNRARNRALAAARYARRRNRELEGLDIFDSEWPSALYGEADINYELAFEAEPFMASAEFEDFEAADLETFNEWEYEDDQNTLEPELLEGEWEMPDSAECSCGGREMEEFSFEAEPFDGAEFEEWEDEAAWNSPQKVRWIQESLNKILGLRLKVDGIMGPQTKSAIRRFQQKNGLIVDGVVGSATERALAKANPPKGSSFQIDTIIKADARLEGFDFDKSNLKPTHIKQIEKLADKIVASWRMGKPFFTVKVVGHTDPEGSAQHNQGLGLRRALAVRTKLQNTLKAKQRDLYYKVLVLASSKGEYEPIDKTNTPQGQARNRRVEVFLSTKMLLPLPSPPPPDTSKDDLSKILLITPNPDDLKGSTPPEPSLCSQFNLEAMKHACISKALGEVAGCVAQYGINTAGLLAIATGIIISAATLTSPLPPAAEIFVLLGVAGIGITDKYYLYVAANCIYDAALRARNCIIEAERKKQIVCK